MAERPWFREIVDEPDPRRRLALVARNVRVVRERTAHVTEIVRQAAPADQQIAALWERFQREFYELGVRAIVDTLPRPLPATAVDIGCCARSSSRTATRVHAARDHRREADEL